MNVEFDQNIYWSRPRWARVHQVPSTSPKYSPKPLQSLSNAVQKVPNQTIFFPEILTPSQQTRACNPRIVRFLWPKLMLTLVWTVQRTSGSPENVVLSGSVCKWNLAWFTFFFLFFLVSCTYPLNTDYDSLPATVPTSGHIKHYKCECIFSF